MHLAVHTGKEVRKFFQNNRDNLRKKCERVLIYRVLQASPIGCSKEKIRILYFGLSASRVSHYWCPIIKLGYPNITNKISNKEVKRESGGDEGDRTPDLNAASVALSQLSYGPIYEEDNCTLDNFFGERFIIIAILKFHQVWVL